MSKDNDRLCVDCRHSAWLVGSPKGFFCQHPKLRIAEERLFPIPSLGYGCEEFESRPKKNDGSSR